MAILKPTVLITAAGALAMVSVVAVAQTRAKSPFASKKPKPWEQQAPAQNPAQLPNTQTPNSPAYQAPGTTSPYASSARVPEKPGTSATPQTYVPPASMAGAASGSYSGPQAAPTAPRTAYTPSAGGAIVDGQYYPGKSPKAGAGQAYGYSDNQLAGSVTQPAPAPYQPPANYQNQAPYQNQTGAPRPAGNGQYTGRQAPLRGPATMQGGWMDRVQTSLDGTATAGIAYIDGGVRDFDGIADIDLRGEINTILDNGLELGAGLRVRAQRDPYRRGFGNRAGDCPAADPACASVNVGGVDRAIKGHTGQFYNSGNFESEREAEIALEGAYIFLRSAYGDVTLGRDDGTAALFSLGAPTLVAVNASNSRVDYTGLDSVKTRNDASGFSEKIRYASPRMLGDTVGFGVQVGASFALNAEACGVDYCVKDNNLNPLDPVGPEIRDVIELAVAVDRKFDNGLSAEITGTYARGSEASGLAEFDTLQSWGAGLELKYGSWVFGSSILNSNNGIAGDGNYMAYDAGLTWKPNQWGVTASYGYADDDLANITSHQGVLAVSYDVNDSFRLGTGVQYIDRDVPSLEPSGRVKTSEDALAVFVEAGITF